MSLIFKKFKSKCKRFYRWNRRCRWWYRRWWAFFIGSNKKKSIFNIFRKPLNFILAIYNGEISLKEAEFSQKKVEKKIEDLKRNYKQKDEKENGTFLSEYWKKSDDAGYKYV